ncbi:MAG: hypothetical protein M1269_08005 [Chloroflexi bacterium]|nr:hypothetical protein [Chloroflexota bacterium]
MNHKLIPILLVLIILVISCQRTDKQDPLASVDLIWYPSMGRAIGNHQIYAHQISIESERREPAIIYYVIDYNKGDSVTGVGKYGPYDVKLDEGLRPEKALEVSKFHMKGKVPPDFFKDCNVQLEPIEKKDISKNKKITPFVLSISNKDKPVPKDKLFWHIFRKVEKNEYDKFCILVGFKDGKVIIRGSYDDLQKRRNKLQEGAVIKGSPIQKVKKRWKMVNDGGLIEVIKGEDIKRRPIQAWIKGDEIHYVYLDNGLTEEQARELAKEIAGLPRIYGKRKEKCEIRLEYIYDKKPPFDLYGSSVFWHVSTKEPFVKEYRRPYEMYINFYDPSEFIVRSLSVAAKPVREYKWFSKYFNVFNKHSFFYIMNMDLKYHQKYYISHVLGGTPIRKIDYLTLNLCRLDMLKDENERIQPFCIGIVGEDRDGEKLYAWKLGDAYESNFVYTYLSEGMKLEKVLEIAIEREGIDPDKLDYQLCYLEDKGGKIAWMFGDDERVVFLDFKTGKLIEKVKIGSRT